MKVEYLDLWGLQKSPQHFDLFGFVFGVFDSGGGGIKNQHYWYVSDLKHFNGSGACIIINKPVKLPPLVYGFVYQGHTFAS